MINMDWDDIKDWLKIGIAIVGILLLILLAIALIVVPIVGLYYGITALLSEPIDTTRLLIGIFLMSVGNIFQGGATIWQKRK